MRETLLAPDWWHERTSSIAWFIARIEDVRSDLSVFHRVDDMESMPAGRFVALMQRLPVYDGAVRFAASRTAEQAPASAPEPAQALSADQLTQLNHNALYGPMQGQSVGLFEVVKVPAA